MPADLTKGPRLAWSLNEEFFNFNSREEAAECGEPGHTIWVGEVVSVAQQDGESQARHVIENVQASLYDECGEAAEDCDIPLPPEAIAEMQAWLDKYVTPHITCYAINDVRVDGKVPLDEASPNVH